MALQVVKNLLDIDRNPIIHHGILEKMSFWGRKCFNGLAVVCQLKLIYEFIYIYVSMCVCKHIYIHTHLSLSLYLSICLSVCLSINQSIYLSSIYLSIHLSIRYPPKIGVPDVIWSFCETLGRALKTRHSLNKKQHPCKKTIVCGHIQYMF